MFASHASCLVLVCALTSTRKAFLIICSHSRMYISGTIPETWSPKGLHRRDRVSSPSDGGTCGYHALLSVPGGGKQWYVRETTKYLPICVYLMIVILISILRIVPSDMRARSLLEDLRTTDPLAREIVDRVDRGAYGTKGRRGASIGNNVMEIGSDDEVEPTSKGKGKTSNNSSGPPPNVQGRGRMVELGQEMEMGGLSTAQ